MSQQHIIPSSSTAVARRGGALKALPQRQAAWTAASAIAAVAFGLGGLWFGQPNLALALAIGTGVIAINPRKWWAAPLVMTAVVMGALSFEWLRLPAVLGAGAVAGAMAAWMIPEHTDALDYVNGALGTAIGSSLGLWAALQLLPAGIDGLVAAALTGATVGLMASGGLLPLAIRFDTPRLPSMRHVNRVLQPAYRPPVLRAFTLFASTRRHAPDLETRRGLCEVATWVFRLQSTMQTLDKELENINVDDVTARIEACASATPGGDSFTKERRAATATHLRRLLDHRGAIAIERKRNEALVEYATAFLEEARAGLAVARELPGETVPDKLPEVLTRLRGQAISGEARRATKRELAES